MTGQTIATSLDDKAHIIKIDVSDMLSVVEKVPDMFAEMMSMLSADTQQIQGDFDNVVISGMGGSAIGADIVAKIASDASVPINVIRNYDLPGYCGKRTLFIAASYSGNTEETLSAYKQALSKGCTVVAITSGGELLESANTIGLPVFCVPSGFQPRAALPYLLLPMIHIFERAGIKKNLIEQLDETLAVVSALKDTIGSQVKTENNPAKQLAVKIAGTFPLVFGSASGSDTAAYRWKCQFNENSKMTALSNSFPELNHNEIVNLGELSVTSGYSLILLRDKYDSLRLGKRFEITKDILRDVFKNNMFEVWAHGESKIARMIYLCYFGDYVSVYAAIASGVDPSQIRSINKLKEELLKA